MKLTVKGMRELAMYIDAELTRNNVTEPSERWLFATIQEWVVQELEDEVRKYAASFGGVK